MCSQFVTRLSDTSVNLWHNFRCDELTMWQVDWFPQLTVNSSRSHLDDDDKQPFRSRANSFPGANRPIGPWPIRFLELSLPGAKWPRNSRSLKLLFLVHDIDMRCTWQWQYQFFDIKVFFATVRLHSVSFLHCYSLHVFRLFSIITQLGIAWFFLVVIFPE